MGPSLRSTDFTNFVPANPVKEHVSVLGVLRKVLVEELGDCRPLNYRLAIAAVHAVLIDSGFVRIDPKGAHWDVVDLRQSVFSTVKLFYTLPEILSRGNEPTPNIFLKIQVRGKFIYVYGSLSGKLGTFHRLRLHEDIYVLILRATDDNIDRLDKDFSDFWRRLKDEIALPLLIDLREDVGLTLPPCFMALSEEIKLEILKRLPSSALSSTSLVCRELCYLVYVVNYYFKDECTMLHCIGMRIQCLGMRRRICLHTERWNFLLC